MQRALLDDLFEGGEASMLCCVAGGVLMIVVAQLQVLSRVASEPRPARRPGAQRKEGSVQLPQKWCVVYSHLLSP